VDDVGEQATKLRHALHSISLFARKTFSRRINRAKFSLWLRGAYSGTLPFVPQAFRRHFLAPRRRETHVLFFPRKVLPGFAAPFFIAFRAKSFRPHCPEPIVFLFGACGPSGAEGRGCEA
jgi:hypothetical protein